ncbi:MAG: cyclic nucleotide-binding domain-containing protein [Deltaproteobacteria bacterium]|nr:cyclic nucleotide-binding domain-containing protein [Deltaproteobacteria bacterium]
MPAEELIKESPLLKDFSPTGLQIIAAVCAEKTFPRGTLIFAENMVAEAMYFVIEGRVAIGIKNGDGKDQHVATLGPGDTLGELALLSPSRRLCSALSESDVKAVEIRADAFKKLLAQKPQACLKLMLNISAEFGKKLNLNRDGLRLLALAKPG